MGDPTLAELELEPRAKRPARPSPTVSRQSDLVPLDGQARVDLRSWLPARAEFSLELTAASADPEKRGRPWALLVLGDHPPSERPMWARLIGVLEADHTSGGDTRRNDQLVAVAEGSLRFQSVRDLGGLDDEAFRLLIDSWSAYNRARCAGFQVVAARRLD